MMWAVQVVISKLTAMTHRWSLGHALALPPRGGVRHDGLKLNRACGRLEVEWTARDIHPWDRNDASEIKAQKFFEQFLADTETAIDRLFRALPYIDRIDATIRDPGSDAVIASGTLERICQSSHISNSARMRLLARGLRCNLNDAYFERLQRADDVAAVY
jgi:hypothetical protein